MKTAIVILFIPIVAMAGFKEIQRITIDSNPSYDNYDRKEIAFSQTLKSVAYPVKKDNKVSISVNGKIQEATYDCISGVTFLPGTESVVFLASRDGCKSLFWVVNGKEYSKYISSKSRVFTYSPPLKQFVYVGAENNKEFIVIDGEAQKKRYDRIDFITFMNDGKTIVFKAKEKESEFIVVNDKEHKKYKMVRDIRFSEFSDIYYLATDGSTEFLVINGKEQQKFPGGVYYYCTSRDSRKFITISNDKKNIVINVDKKTFRFPLMKNSRPLFCKFAPNSTDYSFIAPDPENADRTAIYLNGNKMGSYEDILWSSNQNSIAFSPDSTKFAYVVKEGKREALYVNENKLAVHDKFYKVIFSPDSAHIVYTYQDKDEQIGFSLGLDAKTFRNISSISESPDGPPFIFDGSDRVRYIYEDNNGFYYVEEIVN
ncbi:MAG: hypothetical protein N2746_02570 [Deltaproteobacteria bacterium]|nr:hypothetical protein [Deltaproteobacteria bacterium]